MKNPWIVLLTCVLGMGAVVAASAAVVDCYEPAPGGWRIRISGAADAVRPAPGSRIGVVAPNAAYSGDARLHRRPLYLPADRAMVYDDAELTKIERCGFRPLVVAYNEPRFLFDFHSAGGLLGHLRIGLSLEGGASKWLHEWRDLDVSYVYGRMAYRLTDPVFPGMTVSITACALAQAAGLVARVDVKGLDTPASLIWAYGGASAFFTNWAMTAPEFNYAPKQCAKDRIAWRQGVFTLTRAFDKTDVYMGEVFAAARYLHDWSAKLQGGSTWQGRCGFGLPSAFTARPAQLAAETDWVVGKSAGERSNCVAVFRSPLTSGRASGYIAVGMGRGMAAVLHDSKAAMDAALARNAAVASRVVTHTPDPYLDAAMPMMAFATEGTWGDSAVLHGGWSWRFAYLGWRHWYGVNCYGWTDRVRASIENHVRLNRVEKGPDEGALGSLLEYPPGVFYNMNEVFFDQVRQYFEYTGDLNLMRRIFPVLAGIIAWENRRLRPEHGDLYENALNTWISDQHWYTRVQCSQASAYMLGAHTFLADLAQRLGQDPAVYSAGAARIRQAMQDVLWMKRPGVFAEYLDTRGNRMLHTEPELPTLYHTAEFGAANPLQIYQMLHFADRHLRIETTPNGGKQYWSSNWFPNMARSYTHSTYEMAYAEELNFALTNYLARRPDDAYAIVRAVLCGIFNGPTPGGLACHAYTDGRQRANDEFADAISMWGRAVVEGLFGIVPKRPDGLVELTPQFPADWEDASIETPQFSYQWKREDDTASIEWKSPVDTAVRVHFPVRAAGVARVEVDGAAADFEAEPGVGLTWIVVCTPSSRGGSVRVTTTGSISVLPDVVTVKQGESFQCSVQASAWSDPQGILADPAFDGGRLRGVVGASPGPALLFVMTGGAPCRRWIPVRLDILGRETPLPTPVWQPPDVPKGDLAPWRTIDLNAVFNASVTEVLDRVAAAVQPPPLPASGINTAYYKSYLVAPFVSPAPSDAAWRAKVGEDGIAWTTDGIPFKTCKEGDNIAVVTIEGGFPPAIEFPVGMAGQALFLMVSGTTFAMQSHVTNVRIVLRYADGQADAHELINPFGIGDCWNQYRYHDTAANGFESIGGRSGPAGSCEVADLTRPVAVDTEAHLVKIALRPEAPLDTIRFEAVANDVVFGIMGASVLK